MSSNVSRRSAFTLIELLVVVSIVALLISLLLPALGEARRAGKLAICKSNKHSYAVATQSYSTEHKDKLWSLSWAPNTITDSTYSDLRDLSGLDEAEAVARQATNIIRKRTGRDNFPVPATWIPTVLYNHLALQDYLSQKLPEKMVICPEDRLRLTWASDPVNYDRLGVPVPDNTGRWPYSSSYRMVSPTWTQDRIDGGRGGWRAVSSTTYTHVNHNIGSLGGSTCIGTRRLGDVLVPSQKVVMFDDATRHFGRIPFYWNYEDSRQPFLFFDGSARIRRTGDANVGMNPINPAGAPFAYRYSPEQWQAPLRDGSFGGVGGPSFRFDKAYFFVVTRGGLGGIDFGGPEVRVR